jgi:hypothetical protein
MRMLAALIGVVFLSACAGGPPPEAPVAPTTRPAVPRALDVSAHASADTVCEIVPESTLAVVDLKVFTSSALFAENPICNLRGRGMATAQLFTQNDRLARAYAMDRPGGEFLPHFIGALTIGGQPAARVRPSEAQIEHNCMTVVALSETASLEVSVLGPEACARADRLGEAIVVGLG